MFGPNFLGWINMVNIETTIISQPAFGALASEGIDNCILSRSIASLAPFISFTFFSVPMPAPTLHIAEATTTRRFLPAGRTFCASPKPMLSIALPAANIWPSLLGKHELQFPSGSTDI
jgi:hypothetical protein